MYITFQNLTTEITVILCGGDIPVMDEIKGMEARPVQTHRPVELIGKIILHRTPDDGFNDLF